MKTGAIAGIAISILLLAGCYFLLGAGAGMCNPGYGFLLSPAIAITAIIIAIFFVNNKSGFVANAARFFIILTTVTLLIYIYSFFS